MTTRNREIARTKVNSVEEDFYLGPIVQDEIFYKHFGTDAPKDSSSDEVHIIVSVYKYRVWVEQVDTFGPVWDVLRESFHDIRVEIARCIIDKKFETNDPKVVLDIIKKRFGGPNAIHHFVEFCKSTAWDFTIHESGPQRDNLVSRMY